MQINIKTLCISLFLLIPLYSFAAPALEDWEGIWDADGHQIAIVIDKSSHPARLVIDTGGIWSGGCMLNAYGEEVIHTGGGSFASIPTPKSTHLTVSDGDCEMQMNLIDKKLVVKTKGSCGGANINFDDVYSREFYDVKTHKMAIRKTSMKELKKESVLDRVLKEHHAMFNVKECN